jgi:hypothetical protein
MLILKIQNDSTGNIEVGNYRYQVLINQTVIESGEVKGHIRRDGWQKLVDMVISESLEKKDFFSD